MRPSKTSQPSMRAPRTRHLRLNSTIGRTFVILTQPLSSRTWRFGVRLRIRGIDALDRLRQLLRLRRSILGPRFVATDHIPRSPTEHPASPRVSTSVNLHNISIGIIKWGREIPCDGINSVTCNPIATLDSSNVQIL